MRERSGDGCVQSVTHVGFSENSSVEAFRCFLVVFEQMEQNAETNLQPIEKRSPGDAFEL